MKKLKKIGFLHLGLAMELFAFSVNVFAHPSLVSRPDHQSRGEALLPVQEEDFLSLGEDLALLSRRVNRYRLLLQGKLEVVQCPGKDVSNYDLVARQLKLILSEIKRLQIEMDRVVACSEPVLLQESLFDPQVERINSELDKFYSLYDLLGVEGEFIDDSDDEQFSEAEDSEVLLTVLSKLKVEDVAPAGF